MVALSAPDAISPAIERMRDFLFRPFRLGTFVKLCLAALVTEGFSWNLHSTWSGGHHAPHASTGVWTPGSPMPGMTAGWIAALTALALISIVVGFVLFYLVTRLRFAYFHCLIHNTQKIRPGWRLYGSQATRFFWMNLGVGVCFLLVIALVALSFAGGIWKLAHDSGGHLPVGPLIALILPGIVAILAIVVIAIAADLILRDFILPHYALDNAGFAQAWSAAWRHFRAEPTTFVAYGLLRIFLPLVAWMAIFLILILPTVITVATVALVEIGIHAASAHGGGALPAEGIALQIVIGVVATVLTVLVWIGVGGPLNTAVREYALVFYGGRYPALGNVLAPSPDARMA